MLGLLSYFLFIEKRDIKNLLNSINNSISVFFFYSNIDYTEIPFEFNQSDYDDYFYLLSS